MPKSDRKNIQQRQAWMSVLASSQFSDLKAHWDKLNLNPECEIIREPEIGLAQVRGRMGGTGSAFNLGDTTMTRATIKLSSGELGYSYIQGRHKKHAYLAAIADALLQDEQHQALLEVQLIQPLTLLIQQAQQERVDKVAASKVDFFTLVRGED